MSSLDLLSNMNSVQTPFIIADIGGVSFGIYNSNNKNSYYSGEVYNKGVTYPNFMESLSVNKINGTVNTYILRMVYAIRNGDDPNLLEKVFSKAKESRTMYLSYGDLSTPNFVYRKEEVLITDIKSDIDFSGSKIHYTIQATSKGLLTGSNKYSFSKRVAKPSEVIREILYNNLYGLTDVFYGMKDKQKVLEKHLIPSDDVVTTIEAKLNINILDYLEYLVNCMSPSSQDLKNILNKALYKICVIDDITDEFNGPYFKIVRVSRNIQQDTLNVYTINVGYPDKNVVMNFRIEDDQVFSIFYDYSKKLDMPQYVQRIDNEGNIVSEYSPTLSNTRSLMKTTAEDKSWWTNLVNYPIRASITIKGLLRPAILMSYIYIDARFFGNQHYATGYYIITKQTDDISKSGYKTTLSLLKVGGETIGN